MAWARWVRSHPQDDSFGLRNSEYCLGFSPTEPINHNYFIRSHKHSVWNNVKNTEIFDVKVLPQPAVDLDQEAIDVLTSAEIRGKIVRFLKRI